MGHGMGGSFNGFPFFQWTDGICSLEQVMLDALIMKTQYLHATTLSALSFFLLSCGEDGPNDNRNELERGPDAPTIPASPALPPQRDEPNTDPEGTGAPGTRTDYQPSTGPGGQSNLQEQAPPLDPQEPESESQDR